MATDQFEAIEKELHPQAENLFKQYVNEFAISLLLQTKLLAYQQKADVVINNHIHEALEKINRDKNRSWTRELLIILGSALFGAFIQGFISELTSGNTILISIYVIIGFVGMFMVFWGLRK